MMKEKRGIKRGNYGGGGRQKREKKSTAFNLVQFRFLLERGPSGSRNGR